MHILAYSSPYEIIIKMKGREREKEIEKERKVFEYEIIKSQQTGRYEIFIEKVTLGHDSYTTHTHLHTDESVVFFCSTRTI